VSVLTTRSEFLEHVVETMRELGPVTAKAMFGGWGLYHEGLFFAIIFEDTLYLKVDDENRAQFEAAGLPEFIYKTKDGDHMAMSYRQAPPEALESPAAMAAWARLGYAAALRTKNRKPSRKRKA
jgi:DNA transformation protein